MKKERPLVVLCGRVNVGKSSLFNRLTEKNQALVSNIGGTTRDSNSGIVDWNGLSFDLIDTAGLLEKGFLKDSGSLEKDIDEKAQKQAKKYLDQADLILLIFDAKAGLMAGDRELAMQFKKTPSYRSKLILLANKVDNFKNAGEAAQFNKLGLGEPLPISASAGMGTGDLLDIIAERLKKYKKNKTDDEETEKILKSDFISACIIGKPNVGKSSLLNSILGYERVIVSPIPHTTREPQNTEISYAGKKIKLIDTAGISRQGKKGEGFEKQGILKSLGSLKKADIAMLVVDISEPLTHQDSKIVQEITDRQKSLIIIANKWDLVEERDTKKWTQIIYDHLPFASWAPIQFISAKTGEKVSKIMDLMLAVSEQRTLMLSDSQTEKFLKHVVKIHKPAKGKGLKAPRIYEFKQTKSNPPSFAVRIGPDDNIHFSYLRFMENRLRERHGFMGTPLNVVVTKNKKSHTTYNVERKRKK